MCISPFAILSAFLFCFHNLLVEIPLGSLVPNRSLFLQLLPALLSNVHFRIGHNPVLRSLPSDSAHSTIKCSILFLMCLTSEASWLKKKQNQLSPVLVRQARCDITAWMSGQVNLSLCKQGQCLAQTNKETRAQLKYNHISTSFPIFFRHFFMQTRILLFSHRIPLHTDAALPGW